MTHARWAELLRPRLLWLAWSSWPSPRLLPRSPRKNWMHMEGLMAEVLMLAQGLRAWARLHDLLLRAMVLVFVVLRLLLGLTYLLMRVVIRPLVLLKLWARQ
eukprot:8938750-Pyramimonas_sp.AAC.1